MADSSVTLGSSTVDHSFDQLIFETHPQNKMAVDKTLSEGLSFAEGRPQNKMSDNSEILNSLTLDSFDQLAFQTPTMNKMTEDTTPSDSPSFSDGPPQNKMASNLEILGSLDSFGVTKSAVVDSGNGLDHVMDI